MLFFEGHLDISYNALFHERDPRWTVEHTREREMAPPCIDGRGICTTSIAELREARAAVAVTTLLGRAKPWVMPGRPNAVADGDWPSPEMVHAMAHAHLSYYRALEQSGLVRILDSRQALDSHWQDWEGAPPGSILPIGLIVTMECADPILRPQDIAQWHEAGLRALFLTHFGKGTYAHGNPSTDPERVQDCDGPVTEAGRQLLSEMAKLRLPLDLTHTSDTTFWDAIRLYDGPVYSSHSNCREICPGQRQLSDEMIRAVIERGGVLGVAAPIGMIRLDLIDGSPWRPTRHSVTLSHLADHIERICDLAGDTHHVAIGTDLDGGFGAEACPVDLQRHRDIHRLREILSQRGWERSQIVDLFHGNWLRFYRQTLPSE